jgi:hypothetical protein
MLTQTEASGPKEDATAQPDPADKDAEQSEPGEETNQAEAKQTPVKAAEETAMKPGPGTAVKKGPGRPRKEARTNTEPRATQLGSIPEVGERPRRKAAIRAEENMRKGRDRNLEAWPLLQARANQRKLQRRN